MLIFLIHTIGSKDPKGVQRLSRRRDHIRYVVCHGEVACQRDTENLQSGDSGNSWQFGHILRTSAPWFPEDYFVGLLAVEIEVVIRGPGLYMLDLNFTTGNVPGWYV